MEKITRLLDILLSSIVLIILSPLLLVVMVLLKLTGEGEIFYRQKRIGRHQNAFYIIKFATMLKNSSHIGAGSVTIRNDSRVLPLGKILRKTKLNEVPQIWNILIGEMSIVGPRPLMPKQFDYYSKSTKNLVTENRPGLTGIGSLIFRDEESFFLSGTNSQEIYKELISPSKALLEEWYVHNKSIRLYFKIIAITIVAVLVPKFDCCFLLDKKTERILNELLGKH